MIHDLSQLPRALILAKVNSFSKQLQKTFNDNFSVATIDGGEVDTNSLSGCSYLVCVFDQTELEGDGGSILQRITVCENISEKFFPKVVFVFPYQLAKKSLRFVKNIIKSQKESGMVIANLFLGDVFDTENYFQNVISGGNGVLKIEKKVFPIDLASVSGKIKDLTFSLKSYGKKTAILGSPITRDEIGKHLSSTLSYDKPLVGSVVNGVYKKIDEKIYIDNKKLFLASLVKNIFQTHNQKVSFKVQVPPKQTNHVKRRRGHLSAFAENLERKLVDECEEFSASADSAPTKRAEKIPLVLASRASSFSNSRFRALTLISAAFLLSPIFITLLTSVLLSLSKTLFLWGYLSYSQTFLQTTSGFATASLVISSSLEKIPIVEKIYQPVTESTKAVRDVGVITLRLIKVIDLSFSYFDSLFGAGEAGGGLEFSNVPLEISEIDKAVGFLRADADTSPAAKLVLKLLGKDLLARGFKNNLETLGELAMLLPEIVGENSEKSYALVYQNNKILRASGGVIEGFWVLRFVDGALAESEFYKVEPKATNLSGVVEPPVAIKKYLKTPSWLLSDSGWDPDFSYAGEKIAWFIEKEFGYNIDGLLLVNSNFLNANYGLERAFYQDFAGVTKNLDDKQKLHMFRKISELTSTKDVVFFASDPNTQNIIEKLGAAGKLKYALCGENCVSDFLSISETNLGTSDSQNIDRKSTLYVSLEEGLVKRNLVLNFENKNDVDYPFYIRVLVPDKSGFSSFDNNQDGSQKFSTDISAYRDLKEAGGLFEIAPLSTLTLKISWEGPAEFSFEKEGGYKLFVAGQSGKMGEFEAVVNSPKSLSFDSDSGFFLTESGDVGYNTTQSGDFSAHFFWRGN